MRLPSSDISASAFGELTESTFKVGDAGIILDILRTKIYKDPVRAICREILANARDAHREAGTPDKPIEIYLPTVWSNYLIIKDFGPGINPSRMEDIFIRFGCSTKREDDIQQGAFGLGGKTPFAYTDTFTIVTAVNGIKYTYSAYIDETKVGKMSLLSTEQTSDSNGTEIKIPILENDWQKFARMIIDVTTYWDVKPKIVGDNVPAWEAFEYFYEGADWKIPQRTLDRHYSYYKDFDSLAIIDGVAYKIDSYNITNITDKQTAALRLGIHFKFNIGELSLSASRDSIHYDNKTQNLILIRINSFIEELTKLISDQIEKASSYTEACIAFNKIIKILNNNNFINALKDIKWNENKIRTDLNINDIGSFAQMVTYNNNVGNYGVTRKIKEINFMSSKAALYHYDLSKKGIPRYVINFLFETLNLETIQVIITNNEPTCSRYDEAVRRAKIYNKPKPVVVYDTELLKLIGAKSLKDVVASIPKEKKIKSRKARKQIEEDHIPGYEIYSSSNEANITPTSFSKNQSGIYIVNDYKNKIISSNEKQLTYRQVHILKSFLNEEIVGFTPFRAEKLSRNWKPLITAVKEKLDKELKTTSVLDINNLAKASHYLFNFHLSKFDLLTLPSWKTKLNNDSILLKYINESDKTNKALSKCAHLINILKFFGEKIEDIIDYRYNVNISMAPNCKLGKLYSNVFSRYPLLWYINSDSSDKFYNLIIDYINLIDKQYTTGIVFQLTGT